MPARRRRIGQLIEVRRHRRRLGEREFRGAGKPQARRDIAAAEDRVRVADDLRGDRLNLRDAAGLQSGVRRVKHETSIVDAESGRPPVGRASFRGRERPTGGSESRRDASAAMRSRRYVPGFRGAKAIRGRDGVDEAGDGAVALGEDHVAVRDAFDIADPRAEACDVAVDALEPGDPVATVDIELHAGLRDALAE